MDEFQKSLTSCPLFVSKVSVWNRLILTYAAVVFLSSSVSSVPSSSVEASDAGQSLRNGRDFYYNGLTPSPITRIHRVSNGRLNSRFLTTIPSLEFLHMARRDGQLMPAPAHAQSSPYHRQFSRHEANSPVFYIRLPPAPYMFVPGLGYVSPHPYNTPIIPPSPVMMNPMGMMLNSGASSSSVEDDEQSAENTQNNVISLPLKFLSNGRPAQIQNPKKKVVSKKQHGKKPDNSKTTHLISGGKYSFNGRPSGVFIVNSPVDSNAQHHSNSIL